MPIYEYKCTKCRKEFECLVFRGDDPVSCPDCDTERVKRLMSACRHKTGGNNSSSSVARASSGCATCSGGSCATCH
jgi:putative FmdB family regulatory protein